IYPYTDLLLHDMGEGLADNRPDFEATGREWRTPPLWGLGLIPTVNGHSALLHDGRARNIMEAVLWHGGEAEGAKQHVLKLDKADREALVRFLESL
ncbi:MAG: thiol oxidoreductase, partial [Burkholderiales bacterium]|nr:thiol oxidoreductase [Burkholderiales bacterium]